jgi:hypothetical protein
LFDLPEGHARRVDMKSTNESDQVVTISVSGGDTSGLLSALNRLLAKADDLGYPDARLRVSVSKRDMTASGSLGY